MNELPNIRRRFRLQCFQKLSNLKLLAHILADYKFTYLQQAVTGRSKKVGKFENNIPYP